MVIHSVNRKARVEVVRYKPQRSGANGYETSSGEPVSSRVDPHAMQLSARVRDW